MNDVYLIIRKDFYDGICKYRRVIGIFKNIEEAKKHIEVDIKRNRIDDSSEYWDKSPCFYEMVFGANLFNRRGKHEELYEYIVYEISTSSSGFDILI